MTKIVFPLLLLFTLLLSAQEQNDTEEFPNANSSYLTFDLSTPVNLVTPRYRFGYIQSLTEQWRIGADLGYGNSNLNIKVYDSDDRDNYRLFEARLETYFIFNPTKRINHYISGEVYLIDHKERIFNDYFNTDDSDIRVRFDRANFSRQKYGFNLKYGVFLPFGDKVGMNIYVGAGPRIRNNSFSNIINREEILDYYDDDDGWDFFENLYRNEGRELGFNFALGFKFFYRL